MNSSTYLKSVLQSNIFLLLLAIVPLCACSQTRIANVNEIDEELLNKHILIEVNRLRRKEKIDPLVNADVLLSAAQDQANYMLRKSKVTHYQRFDRQKKAPKNRVDFYGRQFAVVGENCQMNQLHLDAKPNDKRNPPVDSYEKMAELLVTSWKNSPGHYRNMVNPAYEFTYVAVAVNASGEIYACQVFGGSIYRKKYEEHIDTLKYKDENPKRCRFCAKRVPIGTVMVTPDSNIYFVYQTSKLRFPSYKDSRMRLFNPWNDGLAANIVLKSQFPCDSSNFRYGRRAVTGIPLPPVYKKDFRIGVFSTSVHLGKVPGYIKEDFEVNLTVVKNKRTCSEIKFENIPAGYYVDIPLTFGVETKELDKEEYVLDTITASLFFNKAQVEPVDTLALRSISEFLVLNKGKIRTISLEGYASIEGSAEGNALLYTNRAKYLKDYLVRHGIDEKQISTKVTENYADFREDVQETEFAYLSELSNEKLKDALKDRELVKKLEPILEKHRYVHVNIITKDTVEVEITKELVQQMFAQALETNNRRFAIKLQKVQYGMILKGEMSLEDLDKVEIPDHKRYKLLFHNRAAIHFLIDSLNENRYDQLEEKLLEVRRMDTTFRRVRTSLAILEYYRYLNGSLGLRHDKYYKKLTRLPYVDKVIQSRIILNFAALTDLSINSKKRYHNRVKGYILSARLDVDKTFELASYYSFFGENDYAYSLVRSKIDNTENPDDLIYFLKLIHLTDVSIPRETYLGYFKKTLRYSGHEFCSFFNLPKLNFQILNDPGIKEIYCMECAGVLNTGTRK